MNLTSLEKWLRRESCSCKFAQITYPRERDTGESLVTSASPGQSMTLSAEVENGERSAGLPGVGVLSISWSTKQGGLQEPV